MIERVEFNNFKILRDATLPLSPFTLIVGPNASGKSTALQAIQWAGCAIAKQPGRLVDFSEIRPIGILRTINMSVSVLFCWNGDYKARFTWGNPAQSEPYFEGIRGATSSVELRKADCLPVGVRHFNFDPTAIAAPARLQPIAELQSNGGNLAVVLDRLRDNSPEVFEAINVALAQWLPDYDRILFDTPDTGMRAIRLRAKGTETSIKASELSDGTLIAVAVLTLAYMPDPPRLITIEEPDRGVHPRLLRRLQDALYRLSYPESCGEKRRAVQVIATTHSPYFLDLFKDRPEEIVIANKNGLEANFVRLSDQPDIQEILQDASLGGAWYTGVLGGVPAGT